METLRTSEKIQTLISLISFYKEQAKTATTEALNATLFQQQGASRITINSYLATAFELEGLLTKVKDDFLTEANLTHSVPSIVSAPAIGTVRDFAKPAEPVEEVKEMKATLAAIANNEKVTSLGEILKSNPEERLNLFNLWQEKDKTAAYARYDELLPGNTHSKATKKQELSRIASEVKNEKVNLEIKETATKVAKLNIKTTSGITRPFSGEELVNRSANYTTDGQFNVLVLTGSDVETDTSAEDLIRLKAKQLLSSGNEAAAVTHIQTLYAEQGMTKEMARAFLFKLLREDNNSELRLAVMALLSYGYVEKGDYHTMLGHCNSLVKTYSRAQISTDDKGNPIYKFWKDSKIHNFVDSCVNALVERGTFPKSELDTKLENALPTSENPVVVDAETSIQPIVETPVAEEKLSKREQKAKAHREERAAKQTAKAETTKEVVPTTKVVNNTQESKPGHKVTRDAVIAKIREIYESQKHLTSEAIQLLTSVKGCWSNPFNWFNLSPDKRKASEKLVIDTLCDAVIDPTDFQMVNESGEICRIYRYEVYNKTTEGKWQNYAGQGIPTEEAVKSAWGTDKSAAPIALPEITDTKKEQASMVVGTTEDLSQSPTVVDAGHPMEAEPKSQPDLVSEQDGVKTYLHPATKAVLENAEEEEGVTTMIVQTKKGFNAFIQGVKDFKIEGAATIEEAKQSFAKLMYDFRAKVVEHNDRVRSSGKGKLKQLPTFLKDGIENVSLIFKMKVPAKAAV